MRGARGDKRTREGPTFLPVHHTVARRLAAALQSPAGPARLASIPILARDHQISQATMARALHALRKKGLLSFSRGTPIRVVGRDDSGGGLPGTATRLLADLRASILQGRLRSGASLAKIAGYSADYSLSRSTVLQVFAALQAEGLVHKAGKRRIVGKPNPRAAGSGPRQSPVVVVVVRYTGYWRYYLNHFHVAPMFQSLIWELDKYGIDLMLALSEPQPWAGIHPGGMKEVGRLVKSLGTRYRGMLLTGDLPAFPAWKEWMGEFGRDGYPVHFFCDSAAEAESIRSIAAPRGCYRCCYDEAATGALAAQILADRGHVKAAFMINRLYRDGSWMRARMDRITAAGATRGLAVTAVDQDEPFWQLSASMDRLILDLAGPTATDPGRAQAETPVFTGIHTSRKELLRAVPSLASVLDDASITAIVAPNDDLAVNYYVWLRKMGITPGREISLLSFDNNYTSLQYPVSTIDLGYRTLGYQLAHLFIRDVPAQASRDGYLLSRPHLADRGSVADLRVAGGPSASR